MTSKSTRLTTLTPEFTGPTAHSGRPSTADASRVSGLRDLNEKIHLPRCGPFPRPRGFKPRETQLVTILRDLSPLHFLTTPRGRRGDARPPYLRWNSPGKPEEIGPASTPPGTMGSHRSSLGCKRPREEASSMEETPRPPVGYPSHESRGGARAHCDDDAHNSPPRHTPGVTPGESKHSQLPPRRTAICFPKKSRARRRPPRPLDERSSEIWVHTFKPSDREGSGSD